VKELVKSYINGYASVSTLNENEISFVPDGMVLRILSNVIFFCGRAAMGQDRIEMLASKVAPYAKRCKWIDENKVWLVDELRGAFLKKKL
jgi:homoserine kinase type II